MGRRLWGLYLVALHVGVVLAIAHKPVAAWIGLSQPRANPTLPLLRLVHQRMDPAVPAGSSLFLGDSITQSLAVSAVAPLAVNYGISGQRSDELLESMALYGSMSRARRVFIMVGTNDIMQKRGEGLEQRYLAILARVPAGVPVTLSSPPPMVRDMEGSRMAARYAQAACASDSRCTFVDAFAGLSSEAASLEKDGVHLSTTGYQAWIRMLRGATAGVVQERVAP